MHLALFATLLFACITDPSLQIPQIAVLPNLQIFVGDDDGACSPKSSKQRHSVIALARAQQVVNWRGPQWKARPCATYQLTAELNSHWTVACSVPNHSSLRPCCKHPTGSHQWQRWWQQLAHASVFRTVRQSPAVLPPIRVHPFCVCLRASYWGDAQVAQDTLRLIVGSHGREDVRNVRPCGAANSGSVMTARAHQLRRHHRYRWRGPARQGSGSDPGGWPAARPGRSAYKVRGHFTTGAES